MSNQDGDAPGVPRPATRDAVAPEEGPSIASQRDAWEKWNRETREQRLSDISEDQRDRAIAWLGELNRGDLQIIDVGCGAGWLCPELRRFGRVTATDLSAAVLARAQVRMPQVDFIPGDFMELEFSAERYDVVVSLEVLAHVADQAAFIAKLARILRPGGVLILATQNRPVLERMNNVPPPAAGSIRHWVDEPELRSLLRPHFDVDELAIITPKANRFPWKLVSNSKVDPLLKAFFGDAPKRLKERLGWGWTIMTLAHKRNEEGAQP
jgi:SAM-dependent methyltransferase